MDITKEELAVWLEDNGYHTSAKSVREGVAWEAATAYIDLANYHYHDDSARSLFNYIWRLRNSTATTDAS